ncbi:MAG TPA: 30S ribosomal protein S9 [Candidatus Gracilibacteria bacterium]
MNNRAYFYANGKRKTSIATVRLYPQGKGDCEVNGVSLREWADTDQIMANVNKPLDLMGARKDYDLVIITKGGGKVAQSEAIRLGIARAIVKKDPKSREQLKKESLLTRDSRTKERKKPGLRKARRAPQFSKR